MNKDALISRLIEFEQIDYIDNAEVPSLIFRYPQDITVLYTRSLEYNNGCSDEMNITILDSLTEETSFRDTSYVHPLSLGGLLLIAMANSMSNGFKELHFCFSK